MSSFINSILIKKPIELVFNYVTTTDYWPIYHTMSKSVEPLIGHPLKPTDLSIIETVETLGIIQHIEWKSIESSPPNRFVAVGSIKDLGGGKSKLTYNFTQMDKYTIFERIFENEENSIFMKFAEKIVIDDLIDKESKDALAKVKAILESMPC